jgi:hypothetical protein
MTCTVHGNGSSLIKKIGAELASPQHLTAGTVLAKENVLMAQVSPVQRAISVAYDVDA